MRVHLVVGAALLAVLTGCSSAGEAVDPCAVLVTRPAPAGPHPSGARLVWDATMNGVNGDDLTRFCNTFLVNYRSDTVIASKIG